MSQKEAGRQLILDMKKIMKVFEEEQNKTVNAVLKKIGREEATATKKRLQGKGRIGRRVARAVSSGLAKSKDGEYDVLQIGVLDEDVIGSRGADLAAILAFGKKEGRPTRPKDAPALYTINPSNASVWFFGNSPNHPPVFNRPTKPGYVSPEKRPEPAFLEQAAENIEKKIVRKIGEGLVKGWESTTEKTGNMRMRNRFKLR